MINLASDHLRRAAQSFPQGVAIVDGDRKILWSDFDRAVERLARRLTTAGLAPGQSVLIMSGNCAEFLILSFAVWRAGGVMAVVHASTGPNELDYALTNAEPHFLFAEGESQTAAAAAVSRTGSRTEIFDLVCNAELIPHIAPFAGDLPQVDCDAVGVIGYTSGTTGVPKPVAHSHRSIAEGTDGVADIWRIDAADTILVAVPLSWMMGLVILSLTATTRAARIHLMREFSPDGVLDAMLGHGITFFAGSTSMYVKIANAWHRRDAVADFHLRCCISGGEARNEAVFEDWCRITGTPVLDAYAAFECWPLVMNDPAGVPPPTGSAGKIAPGARMRFLGPDGREVAPGEVGEAQGRGPAMMMGYWKEPDLTGKAITPDGWYRTGDYARIDEHGYVYVLGRASDLINRDGRPIYAAEVEQVLSELDYVAQAAVVGLPDADHGQMVAAAIVPMPGAAPSEAAILEHCAARLAAVKVPGMIRIVEALPHNMSGKVLRREVIPMLLRMREAEDA
ncbi:class I adenylate-forming enzyme family protein [Sphingobium sp. SA916]|uniref:class I adenylate-forming enzyme family protein n=1 Tax=Sphingobium sp. SA916 TaxID=1851207 RepID=UPI000CB503C6|nr:class I adenylate-forming enzyme family protein [Sphingobium sp. SA916]PNQ03709.1 hypothetical protein A8G00_09710 [Sphingobium sp. SA916]